MVAFSFAFRAFCKSTPSRIDGCIESGWSSNVVLSALMRDNIETHWNSELYHSWTQHRCWRRQSLPKETRNKRWDEQCFGEWTHSWSVTDSGVYIHPVGRHIKQNSETNGKSHPRSIHRILEMEIWSVAGFFIQVNNIIVPFRIIRLPHQCSLFYPTSASAVSSFFFFFPFIYYFSIKCNQIEALQP